MLYSFLYQLPVYKGQLILKFQSYAKHVCNDCLYKKQYLKEKQFELYNI